MPRIADVQVSEITRSDAVRPKGTCSLETCGFERSIAPDRHDSTCAPRRRTHRAVSGLSDAEVDFRRFADVGLDLFCVVRGYRFAWLNQHWEHVLGWPVAELIGTPFIRLVHPDDQAETRAAAQSFRDASQAVAGFVNRYRCRDGSYRWLEWKTEAPRGDLLYALARDVTSRRQLERALRQSERLAALGTLARGVAHEINNPLTYARANLELLARGDEDPTLLHDARDGLDRMRNTVRQLQVLAEPTTSRDEVVKLRTVVDAALNVAANQIHHRGQLRVDVRDDVRVDGDSSQLTRVLLNLLVNAVEAIDAAGPGDHEVHVRVHAEGDFAVVEVVDTGVGMNQETLERAFDPFYTTKPPGHATGLGLTVSHRVVSAHGGQLQIANAPAGTRVVLRLPLSEQAHVISSLPAPASGTVPRARLLVVDDETLVCRALQRLLRAHHDVETCTSPHDALTRLRTEAFDVVVCDVMMPGLSGPDLYRAVEHEHPERAGRFIFMTGGAFTEDARRSLEATGRPILDKPADTSELLREISRVARSADGERRDSYG